MDFLGFAEKVLRETNQPLTSMEIWQIGVEKGLDKELNTKGKTPWQTIVVRIYVDIRDNPNSIFVKRKLGTTRFFLKELLKDDFPKEKESISIEDGISKAKAFHYHERSLHSYLAYYLYNYHAIYSKTIFHEESNKRNFFAQWLHPDMVGVYFPLEEWEEEVFEISKEIGLVGIKLFSYEIKKELNLSNLRESFFQAVSNSSWANEGYLVTAEYSQEEEFYEEFRRLSNSFGIGLIHLDVEDPDSSSFIFQSKTKEIVDVDTMNKIAQVNPSFKEFLKRIKIDFNSKEIKKEKYDEIRDVKELENKKGLS